MDFDFSFPTLAAGFIFGVLGVWVIKRGRHHGDLTWIGIGVALVAYPYFVSNAWLCWGIGLALLGAAYATRM